MTSLGVLKTLTVVWGQEGPMEQKCPAALSAAQVSKVLEKALEMMGRHWEKANVQ